MKCNLIVFCFYRKYENSVVNILNKFEALGVSFEKVIFVISNNWISEGNYNDSLLADKYKSSDFIQHDGDGWEFGAYELAFKKIKMDLLNNNSVETCIIMNDTVGVHSIFDNVDLSRFVEKINECRYYEFPCAVGEIDVSTYDKSIVWIRSCIFSFNAYAMRNIEINLNSNIKNIDGIDINKFSHELRVALNISAGELVEIFDWLYPKKKNTSSWVGSGSPEDYIIKQKRKLICIAKERNLTKELIKNNFKLLDFVPRNGIGGFVYRIRRKLFMINRLRGIV